MKTLTQQIKEYEAGEYIDPSFETQCKAGWYDWFCQDKVLAKKTDGLYKKIKRILKADNGKLINPDTMYVSFKNICPFEGKFFDCIRFFSCDDNVGYHVIITPKCGHTSSNGVAEIDVWDQYEESFATFKELLEHLKGVDNGY